MKKLQPYILILAGIALFALSFFPSDPASTGPLSYVLSGGSVFLFAFLGLGLAFWGFLALIKKAPGGKDSLPW